MTTDLPAASAGQRGTGRWTRLLMWPLEGASVVFDRLLSARGLCLFVVLVVAVFGLRGWLRPPISPDIGAFSISIFGGGLDHDAASHIVYGPRPFVLFSIGSLIAASLVAAVLAIIWRPRWFVYAAGVMLCAVITAGAAAAINHPLLVELLDQQYSERQQLVAALNATVSPPMDLTTFPRVSPSSFSADPGEMRRGTVFLREDRLVMVLVLWLAILLATRGGLYRRVGAWALWTGAAVAVAVLVCVPRWHAERAWKRAETAERRADFDAARANAELALERYPELNHLRRTWLMFGRLDRRVDETTPAASFLRASLLAQSKRHTAAITELSLLAAQSAPVPDVTRWLGETWSELAAERLKVGDRQGAEEAWLRALEVDPSAIFRGLGVAAMRSVIERGRPETAADMVDTLLTHSADRSLRAAFQAMLGDSYFDVGRFAEARERYEQSMHEFALPKQINYRAMRGILGM